MHLFFSLFVLLLATPAGNVLGKKGADGVRILLRKDTRLRTLDLTRMMPFLCHFASLFWDVKSHIGAMLVVHHTIQ